MSAWRSVWDRIPVFVNYLLMLVAFGLVVLLFPDKLRFRFEYELGKTWPYEDLYAPFDFAIPKDQKIYRDELSSLVEGLDPLYRRLDSVEERQLKILDQKFDFQLSLLEPGQFPDLRRRPQAYRTFAHKYLQGIFERGVVEWEKGRRPAQLVIVQGKTSRTVPGDGVPDLDQAYAQIYDSLRESRLPEVEFLLPVLTEVIVPNVRYDERLNEKVREEAVASVSPFKGMVRKGELMIQRGGIVTREVYLLLEGYRMQYEQSLLEKRSGFWLFAGYCTLTLIILGLLLAYLRYAYPFILRQANQLILILLWPVLFVYLVFLVQNGNTLSPYLLPFAVVPIVIKNFYDKYLALFVHVSVVLLAGFLSSLGFNFILLQLIVGLVVVVGKQESHNWNSFFGLVALVFLISGMALLGLEMTEKGSLEELDWRVFSWLFINSFLVLLAYPITSLLERLLGLVSVLRLTELTDTNRPLLQLLAERAPGTYQHALQVANLSEAAARRIGADHLLVKAGALYHDIGKAVNPEFFIENQSGKNPHEGLTFEESARRIIEHVHEGVFLARKYAVPRIVADFIMTHHGTTRVEFFYRQQQLQNAAEAEEKEAVFRYPGPKPITREATILMMADCIEAACRSLKNPIGKDIDDMVERLIQRNEMQGQFSESSLSFADMEACKQVFKDRLRSVYHLRVEYPE